MRQAKAVGGYTVIEIMIVLSISMIFFISAIALFSTQGQRAAFEESANDLNSEFATQLSDVGSSQLLNDKDFKCTASGSPPRATLALIGGSAANQDCLVVGTAIEAIPTEHTIYYYKVLGNRLVYGAGGSALGQVASLDQSNPTVPITAGLSLASSYDLASGVKIVSSKVTDSAGSVQTSNLVGIYLDFNAGSSQAQNGTQTISQLAYHYASSSHNAGSVKNCIEGNTCNSPSPVAKWTLCLSDDSGSRHAQIDLSIQSNTTSTRLQYIECT